MRISRTVPVLAACLLALALAGCSREPQDWATAQQADTAAAYQQFLQQYPSSSRAPQAAARIKQLAEERDWQAAAAADTRDAYQQFLAQHPDSKYAQEARIRIENFAQAAPAPPTAAGATPPAPNGEAGTPAPGEEEGAAAVTAPAARARTAPSAAGHAASAGHRTHTRPAPARKPSRAAAARAAAPHSRYAQLGAFSSRTRAEAQWQQLERRFPAALRGLKPRYAVGRRAGHPIYRLQVAARSAAAAQKLCGSLKRHAQGCVVVSG